jgi:hypothetical protein
LITNNIPLFTGEAATASAEITCSGRALERPRTGEGPPYGVNVFVGFHPPNFREPRAESLKFLRELVGRAGCPVQVHVLAASVRQAAGRACRDHRLSGHPALRNEHVWRGTEDLRLVVSVMPLTDFSMMAWLDVPEAETDGSTFHTRTLVLPHPTCITLAKSGPTHSRMVDTPG